MKTCTDERIVLCVLYENYEAVAGERVRYRLYEEDFAMPQYYAEIVMGDERAAMYLGEDREKAKEIYTAILRGTVTPCTLQAVVEDFL